MDFSNKSKKLSIILIFIILFNFFIPTYSHADASDALISPIKGLLLAIGDSFLSILQGTCLGDYDIVYTKEDQAGLTEVYTNAYGDQVGRVMSSAAYGLASFANWVSGGRLYDESKLQDRPHIKYTPFKIFANRIALLDINFFHPGSGTISLLPDEGGTSLDITADELRDEMNESVGLLFEANQNNSYQKYSVLQIQQAIAGTMHLTMTLNPNHTKDLTAMYKTYVDDLFKAFEALSDGKDTDESVRAYMGPDDVNAILNTPGYTDAVTNLYTKVYMLIDNPDNKQVSSAAILQKIVAKWYFTLRNIGLVAMLSILVYIGIRIILTSSSSDKAKYKQMFIDWLVAMLLLFFMHYIMTFSIQFVDKLTLLITKTNNDDFFNTTRLLASSEYSFLGLGYTILYLILVFFTLYFTFIYLRRVLYMAFLTLIAPIVAVTYPIDKLNDGKAQAYDMWLKEYLFNLLIQPLHLLLYFILISSAAELANKYMIYSFVALAFMIPAEKLLRRFFGFEKAQTPGLLAGPAGGALMISAMRSLGRFGHGPHGRPGAQNGSNKKAELGDKEENAKKPYFSSNMNAMETLQDAYPGSNDSENSNSESNNNPTVRIDIPNGDTQQNSQEVNSFTSVPITAGYDGNYDYDAVTTDDIQQNEAELAPQYQNTMDSWWSSDSDSDTSSDDESFASVPITAGYDGDYDYDAVTTDDIQQNEVELAPPSTSSSTSATGTRLSSPAPSSTSPSTSTPKKSHRIIRGLKGIGGVAKLGGKTIAKGAPRAAGKAIKFTGRKVTQLAAGAIVGGTLGTLGLAAGLASGDPNKALQYASLGGTTGYSLGKSTRDRVVGSFTYEGKNNSTHSIRDAYRKASLTKEEYLEKQRQEYIDKYVKDHAEEFAKKNDISKRQAKEALKEVAPDCIRNGIEDIDDINNIYDIRRQRAEWEAERRTEWENRRDAGEQVADDPIEDWRRRKAAGEDVGEIPLTAEIAMAATQLKNDFGINITQSDRIKGKELEELHKSGINDQMIDAIIRTNRNKRELL